jgi:uncharacterized membrane-anchored protein
MSKLRLIVFLLVALAQIGVPASMIWKRQHTLSEGRVWKFRTAPVDPVDAMRGRYLALRFEAEEFPSSQALPYRDTVYAKLKEGTDGFAVVDQLSEAPIAGDDVVQAQSFGYYEGKAHLRFSFDRLWVTEANAPAAEQAYFAHSRRENIDAYATVRVIDGDAGIDELYIAGQPLRDYLRAHSP